MEIKGRGNKKTQAMKEKPKVLHRRYCWKVAFEYFYVKQTGNPDYKIGDQPTVRTAAFVFMTPQEDPFVLQASVKDYIAAATHNSSLGSQRVRVLRIEYVGTTEEYEENK